MSSGAKKKNVTPLAGGVRPPITIVEALIKQPEQQRAGVAHEELGRMEVVAKEAEADPARQRGDQRADVVARQQPEVLESQPVDAERARRDRDDARRRARRARR